VTKIISVIQLKGGAGKSTVATNLAAMLAERGKTLLIDADHPQYTAESWYVMRCKTELEGNLRLETATDEYNLAAVFKAADRGDYEYIVIDGPPRMAKATSFMMGMSDLVIIPVNVSRADIWSTFDTEELVKEEREVRPNFKVRLLLNRFRDFTNSAHEIAAEAKKELTIPIMKTTLGFRVSYPDALGDGLCVDELRDARATEEINQLTAETLKLLKGA
jgi:chromosome partitioning protein